MPGAVAEPLRLAVGELPRQAQALGPRHEVLGHADDEQPRRVGGEVVTGEAQQPEVLGRFDVVLDPGMSGRRESAVDSDVIDAMGGHPVDARSRVDIRADDVPDGINAADHAAGLSPSLDNLAAPLNAERRLPRSTVLVATATIRAVATEGQNYGRQLQQAGDYTGPHRDRLPIHRASVVHVDDLDAPEVVVGAVDDPVAAPSGRTQAGQLAAQRTAETVRVLRQGTEDELDASGGDLLG